MTVPFDRVFDIFLFLCFKETTATGIDELNMVRYRNFETPNTSGFYSILGGAEIAFEGSGFSPDSHDNQVRLKSLNTGLTHVTFKAPAQSGKF